jgi:hypothetical protein
MALPVALLPSSLHRPACDRRSACPKASNGSDTTEAERTPDLVARTLNIFEDDLRRILADEWKRRPSGAASPASERGFEQASRVVLTSSCRCNNSCGDAFPHHVRLTGVLKLFKGGVQSLAQLRNCLGVRTPK